MKFLLILSIAVMVTGSSAVNTTNNRNCRDGIPTATLLHSGTLSTLAIGAVASAVYKSRATLRPTTLLLIAVTPPLPARAQIPATLQPASPFQRLLPYLVWQRRAHGTPTILPVGRLSNPPISTPPPRLWTMDMGKNHHTPTYKYLLIKTLSNLPISSPPPRLWTMDMGKNHHTPTSFYLSITNQKI